MENCKNHKNCIDKALENAKIICENKNIRLTQLRMRVLEMIWEAGHKPVKAYDIINKMKGVDKACMPPTVYRALDFLMENNFVHKLNVDNSYIGCSEPRNCYHCYFVICNKCGEAKEFFNEKLSSLINFDMDEKKFKPSNIVFEIQGLCESCN